MTPFHFWFAAGVTLVVAVVCALVNNAQHFFIKELVSFLKETVKSKLIMNGEPDQARKVSKDYVPKLEVWMNESQNYGIVNILGLITAVVLIITGGLFHSFNTAIAILSATCLIVNVLFLPKAFTRLNEVVDMNNGYVLLLETFDKAQENKSSTTAAS